MRGSWHATVVVAAVVGVAVGASAAHAERLAAPPRPQPWLGISINGQDATWGGIYIVDVFDDTPASLCGLRAGDEIIAVDAIDVHSTSELQGAIGLHDVGDKVTVQYVRSGGAAGADVRRCSTELSEQINDPTELLHRRLIDRAIPPFRLTRLDDDAVVDDAGLRGDVAVLVLFSTSCDACAELIGDVQQAADGLAGVRVIAVAGDSAAAVKAFVQRTGAGGEIAVDQGQLVRRYNSDREQPSIIVIDHKGVVRFAAVGRGPEGSYLDGATFCIERAARARQRAQ